MLRTQGEKDQEFDRMMMQLSEWSRLFKVIVAEHLRRMGASDSCCEEQAQLLFKQMWATVQSAGRGVGLRLKVLGVLEKPALPKE